MFAPTDEKELNPGGSHRPVSSDLNKEIRRYAKLGNHVKRYRFSNKYVKDKKVLEVGCGYGFGSIFLKGYYEYVGVDVDHEAIEWAKKNINVGTFFTMDKFQKTHNEESFDVVIAFEVIEHVKDPVEFLTMVKAHCKKHATIIISTPNGYYSKHDNAKFRSKYHIDEYNISELKSILNKAGLEGTYFREHRIDHLDSKGLEFMEKEREDPETGKNKIFNFAIDHLNGSLFWHICKVSADMSGYSTIIAVTKC